MFFAECSESWTSPDGWTGAGPVFYSGFDCLDGLVVMEGTQQSTLSLIEGKVLIYSGFISK